MQSKVITATMLAIALSGCATVKKNVVGETQANVEPFAQETVNALYLDPVDIRASEFVFLRYFLDETSPELMRLRGLLDEVDDFHKELVSYSVELMRVTQNDTEEAAQVAALADSLVLRLRQPYIDELGVPGDEFDAMIEDVRGQKKFLAAIKAVKPIVDIAAEQHFALLTEIETEALPAAREFLDGAVTAEFSVIIEYLRAMGTRKDALLIGLDLVREARMGNADATRELRDSNIILAESAVPSSTATEQELDRAETYILEELRKESQIAEILAADREDYLATRAELYREVADIQTGTHVSRLQVKAWLQAHEALGNGVTNPAKWLTVALGVAAAARAAM